MIVRTEKQRRLYKLLFILVKYIPPVTAFVLAIHAIICLMGYNDMILDNLVDTSLPRLLLMIVASYAFGFCYLHRMCVIYNFIVTSIINIHREIGLGILLIPYEFLTAVSGIIIVYILLTNWSSFKKCNGNVKDNYLWTLRQAQQ